MKTDARGDDRQDLRERHRGQVALGPAQSLPHHHDQHGAARQAQPHFISLHPGLRPRGGLSYHLPHHQRN